ncbi:MAG: VOC family protein [Actinomycetota bacterium]|nr:VOC family protein [Actinomycetota bacterium]PLS75430.1 MAG: glyoxalase [Actinomycetota bacterium]
MAHPIPPALEGRIVPYLMIDGAAEAIGFYERAFGATERYRMAMPDGRIGHAEIVVGGAVVYLADAPNDMPGDAGNPRKLGGTSVLLHRYVDDVDAAVAQAEAAGATVLRAPEDQFYGDRAAVVADPWGHQWSLHTHLRDMSPEEMERAMSQMGG